eukprot:gnl/TRDRNA2_/TRDRNA2_146977_c0_seq2.p1 gnl/TRDRNA2_/TRDRNA2_146977_c0~~gnl/TRDRNA2_/TRDRNA2_146977_c0_seq2.p1  ORF type:complete len:234 (+),score=20.67 gnl/TRDRNA2_/TRDRNA2_146977_c0_seq2:117-818(+)
MVPGEVPQSDDAGQVGPVRQQGEPEAAAALDESGDRTIAQRLPQRPAPLAEAPLAEVPLAEGLHADTWGAYLGGLGDGDAAVFDGRVGELGTDVVDVLRELPPAPLRRATSAAWWESSTGTPTSEPGTWTEYTLDSEDTSVSSTRASTTATGSVPRQPVGVMIREGRGRTSFPGYRGRSVTRRRGLSAGRLGAALRQRHPTHTPNRRLLSLGAANRHPSYHEIGRVGEEVLEG